MISLCKYNRVYEYARGVDVVWIKELLRDFLDLCDDVLGCLGHVRVEVSRGFVVLKISLPIGPLCLDDGNISLEALLQNNFPSIPNKSWLWLAKQISIRIILMNHPAKFHQSPNPRWGCEVVNAGAAGPDFLREGSLGSQLELDLSRDVHSLKELILPNI